MLLSPRTSSLDDLVRRGRITEATLALGEDPEPRVHTLAVGVTCRLARGELQRAIRLGERLSTAPDAEPADDVRRALALGELAAATGRDEVAVTSFRAAGDLLADREEDPETWPWRSGAALSLVRLGRGPEAEDLVADELRLARAGGSAYATALALRTVAAVCLSVDRRALLREAHDLAAGRYERLAAQVATDLAGLVALMAGDDGRAEAVALLRTAEAYADLEDLWPLHSRIRRVLERLGETAQVPRSEVVARLSAAELRIARLAALGGTNRSIGEHLGVTVKAVEWHLSHVYRKLGISGRAELPQMLRVG